MITLHGYKSGMDPSRLTPAFQSNRRIPRAKQFDIPREITLQSLQRADDDVKKWLTSNDTRAIVLDLLVSGDTTDEKIRHYLKTHCQTGEVMLLADWWATQNKRHRKRMPANDISGIPAQANSHAGIQKENRVLKIHAEHNVSAMAKLDAMPGVLAITIRPINAKGEYLQQHFMPQDPIFVDGGMADDEVERRYRRTY